MAKKYLDDTGMSYFWGKLKAYFQEKLVSGTNIKTINNESVLGSGNISVASTPTASTISKFDTDAHMNSADMTSQEVSDFVDSLNPSSLGGLKFARVLVDVTTNEYGEFTIANPTGSTQIFLLRNAYSDGISGSFGVLNLETIAASTLKFRARTLSTGAVNANKAIYMSIILAYVA